MDFIQLRDMQDCHRQRDISAQPLQESGNRKQNQGWELVCVDQNGRRVELTNKHNQPQHFHDLDSARNMARDLGFDHLHVHG